MLTSASEIGTIGEPMRETDIAFWSRQFSEHCLFLNLGLDGQYWKKQAQALHNAWEQIRPAADLNQTLALCRETRDLKVQVLQVLRAGTWLGWIFPTFVDHIIRELDLFVARATTGVSHQQDCSQWLRFMAEHAAFAAHLMDPIERARIRAAIATVDVFENLQSKCATGVTMQLLELSKKAGAGLDAFATTQLPKAVSIIHPVLATHVVREGRRFLYTVLNWWSPVDRPLRLR